MRDLNSILAVTWIQGLHWDTVAIFGTSISLILILPAIASSGRKCKPIYIIIHWATNLRLMEWISGGLWRRFWAFYRNCLKKEDTETLPLILGYVLRGFWNIHIYLCIKYKIDCDPHNICLMSQAVYPSDFSLKQACRIMNMARDRDWRVWQS